MPGCAVREGGKEGGMEAGKEDGRPRGAVARGEYGGRR